MDDSALDIGQLLGAFKRRAWILVASIVVITPIGLLTALLLPPYYSSTAKILVQSQQIPSELVRSTVNVSAAERLALIQQRLTTRNNLLAMADRLELFEDKPHYSRTEVVDALRDAIDIEEIALQRGRSRNSFAAAFTVTYSARSPVIAARVANELVTMVLQENLENRSRRASETRQFLEKKTNDLAAALTKLETEIAAFKVANVNSLPDSLATRQAELLSLQERRFDLENQRVTLVERRRALRDALDGGVPLGDDGGVRLSPEETKLRQLRQQLAQARGIYTDSHPNVRSLRSSIASLKASISANRRTSGGADDNRSDSDDLATYQRERSFELTERQLKLLDEQLDTLNKRVEVLKASVEATPDTEIALTALDRRRADLEAQHADAVLKAAAAVDGEELEINRQAERYEIIEQAQIPEEPDSPPRKLISIGGFGSSILLGIGLILLFELTNRTIRTTRQMVSQVGITPIVAIPLIRTSQETTTRRITSAAYILLLIGIGAGILFLIDQYVSPLDRIVMNLLDDAELTPIVEEARERFAENLERITAWFRSLAGRAGF